MKQAKPNITATDKQQSGFICSCCTMAWNWPKFSTNSSTAWKSSYHY